MIRFGEVEPRDDHNQKLVANVHPPNWKNPEAARRYNLVVIGAGTAGLISANIAASLGAKVALIERHRLGGDCLNVGCVPSKSMIRAARLVAEARRAAQLGLPLPDGAQLDFGAVMERMRAIRARISHEDSAHRYRDEVGADVFLGKARFTSPSSVAVGGATLHFKKAVIASGARAAEPAIPGLAEAGFLTNENVFSLTQRPHRLAVIGGGPIGCELAQAFRRLGCEVTLLHNADHLLPREDVDAAAIVQRVLEREGIRLVFNCRIERAQKKGDEKVLCFQCADGSSCEIIVDEILVGAGRQPNVEGLGLEVAGVAYDPRRGVRVDDFLRTSNRNVYAAGDICMDWKFTHAADAAAKIVVQNALFFGRKRLSALLMPWCTYTDPEVAHVGIYEHEARERGSDVATYTIPLEKVNRAVCDGEEEGFVKVHTRRGSDRILGATIVASHAGEMISELTLAMQHNIGLSALIQGHPPLSDAGRGHPGRGRRLHPHAPHARCKKDF